MCASDHHLSAFCLLHLLTLCSRYDLCLQWPSELDNAVKNIIRYAVCIPKLECEVLSCLPLETFQLLYLAISVWSFYLHWNSTRQTSCKYLVDHPAGVMQSSHSFHCVWYVMHNFTALGHRGHPSYATLHQ
jgi:hypothetical protein